MNCNHNSIVVAVAVAILLGVILGVSYSMKGAADTFTLLSARAAVEIAYDGKIIAGKPIYSLAMTEYHQGLEFLLASILTVTGIPSLDLVYLPLGSLLYSFGIMLLLFSLIHGQKIDTLKLVMVAVAIIAVAFSGGGYVQPFYTVFHQSWGFYLMFLYFYVLLSEKANKAKGRLILILLFIATGLIYYTVNNWLLFFNITVFLLTQKKWSKSEVTELTSLKSYVFSETFLIFSVIMWWLINTITSQELLTRALRQPSKLLWIFYDLLFKREQLFPTVEVYPSFVHAVNLSIIALVSLPILVYVALRMVTAFRPNRYAAKLSNKNLDLVVLLFLIIILSDVVGYGFLGGSYVFIRNFYLIGTFTSATIILKVVDFNFKRYLQLAFYLWVILLVMLSSIRYPYLTEVIADYNVKLQQKSLKILSDLPSGEILGGYKTVAILTFSLKDTSAYKLNTFERIFDQEKVNYNISNISIGELIIISGKDWSSYVMIQEWKVLPPLKTANDQLENNLNLIFSSETFSVWSR